MTFSSLGNNPLLNLDDLLLLLKSDNQSPKLKFSAILAKLNDLDNNLDFIISSSTIFPGTEKKLMQLFRSISKEVEEDTVNGHKVAIKCHSIISKIQEKKPELLDIGNIPRIFAEAHYTEQTNSVSLMEELLGVAESPSKLDLYHLAGTGKARAVEEDFIKQVHKLPHPLENNSLDLIDTYQLLAIAAQKKYAKLARECLQKLTTEQIVTFLASTYGPEKFAVKQLLITHLKEIEEEDPKIYNRALDRLMAISDTTLLTEPWTDHELQTAYEIFDIAVALRSPEILTKIYEKLNSIDFSDNDKLRKICTSGHFPQFAGQFALYYVLSHKSYPENCDAANEKLNELIRNILNNRREVSKKKQEFISLNDSRFLKQLVEPIAELNRNKSAQKAGPVKCSLDLTVDGLTREDLENLAILNPSEIVVTKQQVSRLGKHALLFETKQHAGKKFLKKIFPNAAILIPAA